MNPIRLPPIYSLTPSPSPSMSHLHSQRKPLHPLSGRIPPSFVPSPPEHYTLPSSPLKEEYKTTLEQAKLDQRRYEYAILRDALRRGFPFSAIPGLLASSDSSMRRDKVCADLGWLGGEEIHGHGVRVGDGRRVGDSSIGSSDGHDYGHGHGNAHGQSGVMYYTPSPTDIHPIPPRKRRLDLDDSFLNRAYKRRKAWSGTGSARGRPANQSGKGAQSIRFHHYVPGTK